MRKEMGKAGRIYHFFMKGLFDLLDTTALWRIFDIHRSGIYAMLSDSLQT